MGSVPDYADPYRRCGLSANPFAHGAAGPHTEVGCAEVGCAEVGLAEVGWVDRGIGSPAGPGGCRLVQVIGVKGAGKTSTLTRWRAVDPGPWRYVPPGLQRVRPLPVAPLVYWDEADRAPAAVRWWGWRAATRRRATVVAGTHVDLGAEARAAGLAVDTVLLAPITAAELREWAGQRFAAVDAGPQWELPEHVAVDVAARAGASWRVAGDLLHAWVAQEVSGRSGPTGGFFNEDGPLPWQCR